jgi:superfamily I DNA/RNA helicase
MDNYSKLCQGFVTNPKSMIIAPAGHGKTHTIAECMEFTKGNQLILTHTHAGVASLKFKISKLNSTCSCTIETISSFAQKYVNAFYQDDMPDQDDKEYFPFIIKEGIKLFGLSPIAKILKANYCGLFVDEYQDCTVLQHDLIMTLSKALPTHILGDPLQGIFGFNDEPLIDMGQHLKSFDKTGELTEPWRWKDSNQELGESEWKEADCRFI